MPNRSRLTMPGLLLMGAAAAGCGSGGPQLQAANAYPADSPLAAGQHTFLYDAWGTEVLGEWPPADFMLGLMTSEPEVFGDQYQRFGFIRDPGDQFPVGFKRGLSRPDLIHETCAMCHVAELQDGRLWMGAPNTKLDIGRFQVEVNQRWVAAGKPALMTALAAQKAGQLGPGRFNAESSDYPMVVAADFPPYFNLGRRSHLNYLGTGHNARTEISFAIYTFGAGSPDAQQAQVPFPDSKKLADFVSFLGALDPPPPPKPDAALVTAGQAVFQQASCGSCHHLGDLAQDSITPLDSSMTGQDRVPGADPGYQRGSVHTDPLHEVLLNGTAGTGSDQGFQELIMFIAANNLDVGGSDGYTVLDLRGLWATAPYLHNGSVPTLADLFNRQQQRPAKWKRGDFQFDTSMPGNQNIGHEFGVDLADADKQALVAYLMSL